MSAIKPPRPRLAFNVEKQETTPDPASTEAAPAAGTASKTVPAHRANRKVVQVWLNPDAYTQLKIMAVRDGVTMQDELLEALDDLFAKRGEHRIAKG
jgi:hypothetical protein